METKILEVRDHHTFIPVVAVRMITDNEEGGYLLRRAGYSKESRHVTLFRAVGGEVHYDPYAWGNRTMQVAHSYIRDAWEVLKDGEVVDVEFILGEKPQPKQSERFDHA